MPNQLPDKILNECDGFFVCMGNYLNDVTNGIFWAGALLSFAIIVMISTSRFGKARSYGFAGFVSLIGSIWLATIGFLSWWVASAFILAGVTGFVVMITSD